MVPNKRLFITPQRRESPMHDELLHLPRQPIGKDRTPEDTDDCNKVLCVASTQPVLEVPLANNEMITSDR